MTLNVLDPLRDPRWRDLVDRHPSASVFHTPAWLEALRDTYGYQPVAFGMGDGTSLDGGLVFCRVKGWAWSRFVSLPFSDHCDPLVSEPSQLPALVAAATRFATECGWGQIELRPRTDVGAGLVPARTPTVGAALAEAAEQRRRALTPTRMYCLHTLDLRPDVSQLFAGFHHSSTQRAIRRAEREGVTCDTGSSDELLRDFFSLLRMSRRRHGLPPQPISWFRNLRRTMGERMVVRVARHRGQAVAAVLTLTAGRGVVYKYGGSDAAHHALGAMPFLFWQVIQAAKDAGAAELDLGRSDLDQPGLITFKDHLGAKQSIVTYYGQTAHRTSLLRQAWVSRTSGRVVSALPNMALDLAGRLLYRRMG